MSLFVMRLPDVGEGVAEAELVAWHVAVGDAVTSDTVVADVLTDKATVEIYAPIAGTVVDRRGDVGDILAIGSDFLSIDSATPDVTNPAPGLDRPGEPAADEAGGPEPGWEPPPVSPMADGSAPVSDVDSPPKSPIAGPVELVAENPAADGEPGRVPEAGLVSPARRGLAAPAVRERARRLGVDLAGIDGSGPDGRVTHEDLDRIIHHSNLAPIGESAGPRPQAADTTAVPILGLRRRIAARMSLAADRIPHITYVDEVDMTALERLRGSLTAEFPGQSRLTVLPFIIRAIVLAVADQPQINATYDDEAEVLTMSAGVHVGIATQTDGGLLVPVVHAAETLDVWQAATELRRVSEAARSGTATRRDLGGSTITITSLGALGGLVTTPLINHPEVAIVGINKMQIRPVWNGDAFVPRTMMNLSSSFDHRIVDGWDAATFVQRIKHLLEEPALLFAPRPG